MSSTFTVQRICEHCGNEFTARTTVTRYCSSKCNKRDYKARKRAEKIEQSNKATVQIKERPLLEAQAKEFLTVKDVSVLLGCSKRTVYRLIDNGTLKAVNLGERLTRIRKIDLLELMEQSIPKPKEVEFNIDDCYTLIEIKEKFGVSENMIYKLIKRNNIPKVNKGRYVYVPKKIIDDLMM